VRSALVVAIAGLIIAAGAGPAAAKPRPRPKPVPAPEPSAVPAPPASPVEPSLGEAPPLASDQRMIVGILDVRVAGMNQAVANEFEAQLERLSSEAAKGKLWIGTRAQLKEMLAGSTRWIDGCLLGPCMKVLHEQTRVAVVLTVFLQSMGTTYRYVITLIRTDTGAVIDQRTEPCGACTQGEAVTAATIASVDALLGVPDKLTTATLADPAAVALRAEAPFRKKLGDAQRRSRTTAIVLAGLAALGGGLGGYWLATDRNHVAGPALGAAAGFATASVLSFALTW
jgi:hypothetical protein